MIPGGRVVSRQGCRRLPGATQLRAQDSRCEQLPGELPNRWHNGIDVGAPEGAPILSPWPGRIVRAYQVAGFYDPAVDVGSGGYGRSIVVEFAPALLGVFAHCLDTRVDVGAQVARGELLARVGRTAGTRDDPTATIDFPHLHQEFAARWPLRSEDVDLRYDVAATWSNMGIEIGADDRLTWSAAVVQSPPGAGPTQPALPASAAGIASGAPSGSAADVFVVFGLAWLVSRRRKAGQP